MAKQKPSPVVVINTPAKETTMTTSLLVVYNDQILLQTSKSKHREPNQFDPPSCSENFSSDRERLDYIKSNWINLNRYSKPELKENFCLLENRPIKFIHKDDLSEKVITAYVLIVKRETYFRDFLRNTTRDFPSINSIVDGIYQKHITPMFKKVIEELSRNMVSIKKHAA